MVTTTVHLLRHGEVHNPTGVLYGRLDGYHLSERGVAMAERIAAHLAGPGPDGAPRRGVGRALALPVEPVPAVLGRGLSRAGGPDARGAHGCTRRRPRARGRRGQPPAADLGGPSGARGQAAVARPPTTAVQPGLPHVGDLGR